MREGFLQYKITFFKKLYCGDKAKMLNNRVHTDTQLDYRRYKITSFYFFYK